MMVCSENYRFLAAFFLTAFLTAFFFVAFFLAAFFFAIVSLLKVAVTQPQTNSVIVTIGGLSLPPSYQM